MTQGFEQVAKIVNEAPRDQRQKHAGLNGSGSDIKDRRLLSIEELGQYLGIRPQTIRNRLSARSFPIAAKKVCGRIKFDKRDIEKYLDKLKPHVNGVDSGKPICDTSS